MPKRLFWMSSGYVAGATSSWWVQRKVKREVEKVLPQAIRNEFAGRVTNVRTRAVEATSALPGAHHAKHAWQRIRPQQIDLTDAAAISPSLSIVDGGLVDEPGIARLRDRARRGRR